MAVILAIDLAKAKSLFCWYQVSDQSHTMKTVLSTPQAFHDALLSRPVDRVVIEVCDMAGWIQDLCQSLSISAASTLAATCFACSSMVFRLKLGSANLCRTRSRIRMGGSLRNADANSDQVSCGAHGVASVHFS